MILLMRNTTSEFVPGHDWTAVRMDAAIIDLIRRRATACLAVRWADESIAELRYWDVGAVCVASPDPDAAEAVEAALGRGGGWAAMEDGALGSFDEAKADCLQMVISSGAPPSVGWAYRVGSEPIRTCDVPLGELRRRLGRPLGDSLALIA